MSSLVMPFLLEWWPAIIYLVVAMGLIWYGVITEPDSDHDSWIAAGIFWPFIIAAVVVFGGGFGALWLIFLGPPKLISWGLSKRKAGRAIKARTLEEARRDIKRLERELGFKPLPGDD